MARMPINNQCGWHGKLNDFLRINEAEWGKALVTHHLACMNMPAELSQKRAWHHCWHVLQKKLALLVNTLPVAKNWTIIFEYELPRERGRRPDVVILTQQEILVLEFKDYASADQAQIDQASAYARDLQHYHAASHTHPVLPFLVLTKANGVKELQQNVCIISPDSLNEAILEQAKNLGLPAIHAPDWLMAEYEPLPTLVDAARTIFQHQPLPQIHKAHSAGIPQTIAHLLDIARETQTNGGYHLALVTGVPGAGKTLVGLQFVYDNHFATTDSKRSAIFLSGNRPLVAVLQYVLENKIFVQDVLGFLKNYGGDSSRSPDESIIVFDEAQRAWDQKRSQRQRANAVSEPEEFLRIGQRKSWAMMVGLIGEGQEIYLGEESGLRQWNDAIAASHVKWVVHCPNKISSLFTAAVRIDVNETLNLTTSLRSHLAEHVQEWIRFLIDGEISAAAAVMKQISYENFNIYLARRLEQTKRYVRERYAGEVEKRYGLIASSQAGNLANFGVYNNYDHTNDVRIGPWFNDPPHMRTSSCQLEQVITEFQCQGLELDFPIVCWGDDLTWQGEWKLKSGKKFPGEDPHRLRLNSYRVLLSRGRDGMIIYVPDEPGMDQTFEILRSAGVTPLA